MSSEDLTYSAIEDAWPPEFHDRLHRYYGRLPVVVAGADGFLGYNCVLALRALGARVTAVTRSAESRAASASARVFRGGIGDPAAMAFVAGSSVVFNCAGSSTAAGSLNDSVAVFEREAMDHIRFLDACSKLSPSPFVVFPSTRMVYGRPQYLPVDERHPVRPRDFYSAMRLTIEHFLEAAYETRGLRSCTFRLSNPYGPFLESKQYEHNIITKFCDLIANGKHVKIFGKGAQLRDYIHVFDVVNAFLVAGMNGKCRHDRFNLGGPRGISVLEAVRILVDEAGGAAPEFVPWPANELLVETGDYVTDNTLLLQRLDLPEMIAPEEGLRGTIHDYLRQAGWELARHV